VTPTGIEADVCRDIAQRQAVGVLKYGVTVSDAPLDLLRWLTHAYQELLDGAVYLRRAMRERYVCKRAAPGWMRGRV